MRIWSLDPGYLDARGLVAAWREGLLAQKVLEGRTKGYRNHPQLERFLDSSEPLELLRRYLDGLAEEADKRGYAFDRSRIEGPRMQTGARIPIPEGQAAYELALLIWKLRERDARWLAGLDTASPARLGKPFRLVPGGIAPWEKVRPEVASRTGA